MSGIVIQYLIGLVRAQVERHGVAVWFDPERRYQAVAHLRPHRAAYRTHAERVERVLGLAYLPFTLEQLAATETFPGLAGRLQAEAEAIHPTAADIQVVNMEMVANALDGKLSPRQALETGAQQVQAILDQ